MVKLDWVVHTWSGVSAHWLGIPGSRFERSRWGGRQVVSVGKSISAAFQLIR
jgi:hypothetical protein